MYFVWVVWIPTKRLGRLEISPKYTHFYGTVATTLEYFRWEDGNGNLRSVGKVDRRRARQMYFICLGSLIYFPARIQSPTRQHQSRIQLRLFRYILREEYRLRLTPSASEGYKPILPLRPLPGSPSRRLSAGLGAFRPFGPHSPRTSEQGRFLRHVLRILSLFPGLGFWKPTILFTFLNLAPNQCT